jgi:hypothetical protein
LRRLRAAFAVHTNLSRAAREAGISRQRAYRLLGERTAADLLAEEARGGGVELGAEPKGELPSRG